MNRLLILLCLFFCAGVSRAQETPFERDPKRNTTATYGQIIPYFEKLARQYPELRVLKYGMTDSGEPLHLVVVSRDRNFDPAAIRKQDRRIILINNGIHPGEPEGIDASMMLVRDLLKGKAIPQNVVLCFIPVYNIGGALNRGVSRANQNGPESYGFRGNARNLDLNRDFIKTDSRNSYAFQQIFNEWQPDVFIDNHTSNGADYQYAITLIDTQKDKLNPVLAAYMTKNFTPELYRLMAKDKMDMTPYVDFEGETPESGIQAFLETSRYSTGYAALHNTIAFMTETHMWKPFSDRVASTYQFMKHAIDLTSAQSREIGQARRDAKAYVRNQEVFPVAWKLDRNRFDSVLFKGYESSHRASEVSGAQRLFYDRSKPYERMIRNYNTFTASAEVKKPKYYIIPQAWGRVIELLKVNRVSMQQLSSDMELEAEMYYVDDYKTSPRPYEGHYLHSSPKLRSVPQRLVFRRGDYIVPTDQEQNRYIVETLEPGGVDSFFSWNFFDSVLGQKEYFSAYIFEDEAAGMLKADPELRKRFEEEKERNPDLAKSGSAQLNWIYKNSEYYEKTYLRYPVARLMADTKFETK
ncbi:MAG TPA: M14 family metallopeptidase [Sphingobacteriaceae bacterium]